MGGVDLLFTNGDVLTMTGVGAPARTLAVEAGRIVYVGDRTPEALRAGASRIVDLGGRALVPGFHDAHARFSLAAALGRGVDLSEARDLDALAHGLRDFRRLHPDTRPLLGSGVGLFDGPLELLPDRHELDRIEPEVPIFLLRWDLMAGAANTAMLHELVVRASVAGAGGAIDDDDGVVVGTALAQALSSLSRSIAPAETVRGLVQMSNLALSKGVTTVHTLEGDAFLRGREIAEMRAARRAVQVRLSLYHRSRERRWAREGGYFAGSLDAAFAPASGAGALLVDPARIERAIDEAHRAGFQVAVAAVGEGAIDVAIRAYERALQRAPSIDHRHRIEICAQPTLAQLDRIADLGISIVVQPARLLAGAPHGSRQVPLRRMLERGILLAAGSGCPAAPMDPIAIVAAACLHPREDERLTPAEALALVTSDAARATFEESDRGTLTAGKRADLVVLSRSPLAVPPESIGRIRVEQVWLGGALVQPQSLSISRYLLGSLAGRLKEALGLVD